LEHEFEHAVLNIADFSVQTTLAAVVSEKEKLIAENVEMKAICEELMAMVEGGNATASCFVS
jgi:hypothetical protein